VDAVGADEHVGHIVHNAPARPVQQFDVHPAAAVLGEAFHRVRIDDRVVAKPATRFGQQRHVQVTAVDRELWDRIPRSEAPRLSPDELSVPVEEAQLGGLHTERQHHIHEIEALQVRHRMRQQVDPHPEGLQFHHGFVDLDVDAACVEGHGGRQATDTAAGDDHSHACILPFRPPERLTSQHYARRVEFPLVSVVLPMRNRADVVGEALTSVLQQSYSNLEVIVVDDASTDDSVAEVERVADPRVRVVRNEGEHGAAAARNVGLRHANGRYLAFQDSDDWWHPEKLAAQMHVLLDPANESVAMVTAHSRIMRPGVRLRSGPVSASFRLFGRNDVLDGRLTTELSTQLLVIDRQRTAAEPAFDTEFPSLEEWDMAYSCLPPGNSTLAVLDADLVDLRRGRDDHVARPAHSLVGYERFLSKYAIELANKPETVDWYHYRAMREALILRNRTCASEHRTAIKTRSALLGIEYWLGWLLGYNGLAVATRLRLRPALASRHT